MTKEGRTSRHGNTTDRPGIVEHIDSIGQLHGTWGGLAIIPEVDEFEIVQ